MKYQYAPIINETSRKMAQSRERLQFDKTPEDGVLPKKKPVYDPIGEFQFHPQINQFSRKLAEH